MPSGARTPSSTSTTRIMRSTILVGAVTPQWAASRSYPSTTIVEFRVPPRSSGTRSGCRWERAASTRSS